jgi:predicted regulator of Ras-like GTPase activity (Roadblock/LC7/MglB family)
LNEDREALSAVVKKLKTDPDILTAFVTREDGMTILSDLSKEQANLAKMVVSMAVASLGNLMQKLGWGELSFVESESSRGKMISTYISEHWILSVLTPLNVDTREILEKIRALSKQ